MYQNLNTWSAELCLFQYHHPIRQNMTMHKTRYVDGTPTSEVTPVTTVSGTSTHPTMVTLVNIMVLNGWLTSYSFHVNQPPHSWDKAISDSDLETPKVKVMGVVKGQGHTVGPESY